MVCLELSPEQIDFLIGNFEGKEKRIRNFKAATEHESYREAQNSTDLAAEDEHRKGSYNHRKDPTSLKLNRDKKAHDSDNQRTRNYDFHSWNTFCNRHLSSNEVFKKKEMHILAKFRSCLSKRMRKTSVDNRL